MQRCTTCIIPSDYPGVTFDEQGRCNFCLSYKPYKREDNEEDLVALLNSRKAEGPYDCIVPLSGGKDSVFVLYYAVKKLGLRAVAVSYDNCFVHEVAKRNMVTACERLHVPLIVKEAPGKIHKKIVRQALAMSQICRAYLHLCTDCGLMHKATTLDVARKYNVPWILWGSSTIESANAHMMALLGGKNTRMTRLRRKFVRIKQLGLGPVKFLRLLPHLALFNILSTYRRWSMGAPLKGGYKKKNENGNEPTVIRFYDYVDWDVNEEVRILKEEPGWNHPEDKESRFDCTLHCFGNARFLQDNKISLDGTMLCNYIREGKISREEALAKELEIERTIQQECLEVVNQCGMKNYKSPPVQIRR